MALCGQLGCPIQLRRKEGCGSLILATFNDRFGDMRCVAAANLLHLQSNAALAIAASAKGGFVRTADLYAKRSEGPQSALHVEMCIVQQSDRSLPHHCHSRPIAAVHVHLRMLQCGPSLRTFVHLAAFWLANTSLCGQNGL